MSVFACLCLILMFIRFGDIKLGQDHELPKYTNILWFAMLFVASMGIGLMFYGVAEPLNHFLTPPNLSTDNLEMVKQAMNKLSSIGYRSLVCICCSWLIFGIFCI